MLGTDGAAYNADVGADVAVAVVAGRKHLRRWEIEVGRLDEEEAADTACASVGAAEVCAPGVAADGVGLGAVLKPTGLTISISATRFQLVAS